MKIQILGSGCQKCNDLLANVQKAVAENHFDCEVEKVSDIEKIVDMGVMVTPALAFDGKVISSGKVLSVEEISDILVCLDPKTCCCCCGGNEKQTEDSCCCGVERKVEEPCCCGGKKNAFLKKVIAALLLVFVFGSILYMIDRESNSGKTSDAAAVIPQKEDVLKVYYFHGNQRCFTCSKIEELTRYAVGNSEKVKLIVVNVEEPQNEHFIKDFQLTGRVVVMERRGKFEKFDKVWQLVRTPAEFDAYIKDGIKRLSE